VSVVCVVGGRSKAGEAVMVVWVRPFEERNVRFLIRLRALAPFSGVLFLSPRVRFLLFLRCVLGFLSLESCQFSSGTEGGALVGGGGEVVYLPLRCQRPFWCSRLS